MTLSDIYVRGPPTYLKPRVGNMRMLERHQLCKGCPISGVNCFIDLKCLEREELLSGK